RLAVMGLIQEALRRTTGRHDLQMSLVADLSHNTILRERIAGRDLWVHRHNAARIMAAGDLPDDHPYPAIGQPVMVPGTNRTSSFVVVGGKGAAASLHSVDHGAGRTVERFEQRGLLSRGDGVTRQYTYGSPAPEELPHLSDEAVEEVMSVAAAAEIATP